jgi:H/ACA ribonucleoprotein complex subunit 3
MIPRKIRKCEVCGSYTMKETHCGKTTLTAHPPKYSPEDKYAKYRRMEKGIEE